MRTPTVLMLAALVATTPVVTAAARHWQTGTWRDTDVTRRMV